MMIVMMTLAFLVDRLNAFMFSLIIVVIFLMVLMKNTSFELSHPESILAGCHDVGECGQVVELTIPDWQKDYCRLHISLSSIS